MLRQQHQFFTAMLLIADAVVVAAACVLAWCVRRYAIEGFSPESWETYFKEPLFFFAVPITAYVMWAMGLYRPRRDRSIFGEMKRLAQVSMLSIGAMIVALWLVGNDLVDSAPQYTPAVVWGFELDAARVQLGALAIVFPVMLCVHRAAFRLGLRYIRRRGWNQRHAAIIGHGRLGQIVARTLSRNSWTGIQTSFFISHHDRTSRERCLGRPVYGGLADLETTLEQRKIDAVFLALPTSRANQIPEVLKRLERFSVDVRIVPDYPPRHASQAMSVVELDGMPVLSYRENPTQGLGGFGKRLVDLGGAAAAVVLFGPLMLLIAALIKMGSDGPAIFRQRRVSLGGEEFWIYKFRTMRHAADETQPAKWTERDDPRITGIGKWLRQTSLDELPQLFNVIAGDMSLVGPRPERPELIEQFRDDWRGYMLRQHVKAGITGWAQVKGLRGDTCLRKRLQHDLYYIRHWSLGFDLKILWMTVLFGFVHRNAH